MNFDLTPEQRAIQETVAAFFAQTSPIARVLDEDGRPALEAELWRGLSALGALSTIVPEEYGGAGLGVLDLALIMEAAGRHVVPAPLFEHTLATYAVVVGGSAAQKNKWLPVLASGEKRATIAFAEGDNGWLPAQWKLPASAKIDGEKRFVAHAADADLFVVGLAGGRLALVEAGPAVSVCLLASFDITRTLFDVAFTDAPAQMLQDHAADRVRDAGLALLAAEAYGGALRCVEMASAHVKERRQFGQAIANFQAVKHQVADMALEVMPSIGLYWRAAHAVDCDPARAPLAAALAKAHITDVYARSARRLIELLGGIGYTWEFGAHLWLKRSIFDRTVLGLPALHYERAADLAGWASDRVRT